MSESPKGIFAETLKPITNEIIAYANDKKRCYAIGLEGEWGSGKTRYLEEIVRPVLEEEGFSMVRVSLFGVDSPDALYEKIGSSIFHLDDENSKGKKIVKETIGQLSGVLKNKVSSYGVNISLNTSMKTFVDLVLRKNKHILVFDDLERRQSDSSDLSLFGAINDLVENRGFKVIIVSSSIRNETDNQGKSLDANIREKIIWKVLDFSPDPSALASEILDIGKTDDVVFDVTEIVGAAAKAVNCRNARALMKAGGFTNNSAIRSSFEMIAWLKTEESKPCSMLLRLVCLSAWKKRRNRQAIMNRAGGLLLSFSDMLGKKKCTKSIEISPSSALL